MAQDPIDPVVALLLRSPLSPAQRRAASEAFTSSRDEDELQARMEAMKLPKAVRAGLWDLKYDAPKQPPPPQTESALSRFVSSAAPGLNPIPMVKGVWNALPIPQALGGAGVIDGPVNTAKAILSSANDQRMKADEEFDRGNVGKGFAHSVAAAIPVAGPWGAETGERMQDQLSADDWAGAAGTLTGAALPMAVTEGVMRMRGGKVPAAVKGDALEREAVQQVAQRVLAPKDRKYQAMAQDAAKELLKRGVQGDRTAIQQWADDLIADAGSRIDDVIDQYAPTDTLKTKPVVDTLDQVLKSMEFDTPAPPKNPLQGVVTNASGQPVRLPGPAAPGPQVNPVLRGIYDAIKTQRDFVAQRGATMTFEDMRRLRQQLDGIGQTAAARAKMAGDLSLEPVERATKEAGNALRAQIAAERPELAAPNADMHLGLAVRDILDPVKGRPAAPPSVTTGATGGMHATGAIIGGMMPGPLKPLAAWIGSVAIPAMREAEVSPANQLRLAQDKYNLAQALKAGQTGRALSILRVIGSYVPTLSGQVGRITEPQTGTR